MKQVFRRILPLAFLIALITALSRGALAQDFYGEGNVLIAVDLGQFCVNEDVSYPEGTMGTLIWGEDALTGTSTRPAFESRAYTPTLGVIPAEEYEIETVYEVGQTRLFPCVRYDDPEYLRIIGYVSEEDAQELLHSGAMGFLRKPYSLADLAQRIRQILD